MTDDGKHPPSSDALIGTLVADRFEVLAFLGEGGTARVYRARQQSLDRLVALKLLDPRAGAEPGARERFLHEARAASSLRSPGAPVIHEFGEWEGQLFIAMELLDGVTLGELLAREFPMSAVRIAELLGPVCEVLQEAHRKGLVHRDVKPQNIVVVAPESDSPTVKLVDFGLALGLSTRDPSADAADDEDIVVHGTPTYMSPEQCRGALPDERSDLYSLGAVLYELLCGEPPFTAASAMEVVALHLHRRAAHPARVRPDLAIHPGLAELAMRALAKQPGERPATAEMFLRALRESGSEETTPNRPPRGASPPSLPMDRMTRVRSAAIPSTPLPTKVQTRPDVSGLRVLVRGAATESFAALVAALRTRGFVVDDAADAHLGKHVWGASDCAALVLDLREPGNETLERRLADWRASIDSGLPAFVVGPADAFSLMSDSLTLGVTEYIPDSKVAEALPAALVRVMLRRRTR